MLGDRVEPSAAAQCITVLHIPQRADGTSRGAAERYPDFIESVELPGLRLSLAAVDRSEVVSVDRSSAAGDRAGRPLGMVLLVPSYALLGRYASDTISKRLNCEAT